eukprot:1145828-Amphidinium_carterae.1
MFTDCTTLQQQDQEQPKSAQPTDRRLCADVTHQILPFQDDLLWLSLLVIVSSVALKSLAWPLKLCRIQTKPRKQDCGK